MTSAQSAAAADPAELPPTAPTVAVDDGEWGTPDDAAWVEAPPPTTMAARELDRSGGAFSAAGSLRSRDTVWLEHEPSDSWAHARQSLNLSLRHKKTFLPTGAPLELRLRADGYIEGDLAHGQQRDQDAQSSQVQVIGGDTFVALSLGPAELTIGRQVVPWGQGVVLSPVDVVNPRDLRRVIVDLEDVRMAVLATRLGMLFGSFTYELMAVHEAYFGLLPPINSDYSPFRRLLADQPGGAQLAALQYRIDHTPRRFFGPQQVLASATYRGRGLDLGVYAASILDQQGVPLFGDVSPTEDPRAFVLPVDHPRYTMLGTSGALPAGAFVLGWELALHHDRSVLFQATDPRAIVSDEVTQAQGMLGVTYQIRDGLVGVEAQMGHVFTDSPHEPVLDIEALTVVAQARKELLSQQVRCEVAAIAFGVPSSFGWLVQAGGSYKLAESLRVGLEYVTYHPHRSSLSPISGFAYLNELSLRLRWDFVLP
jgi:hypothetical protein